MIKDNIPWSVLCIKKPFTELSNQLNPTLDNCKQKTEQAQLTLNNSQKTYEDLQTQLEQIKLENTQEMMNLKKN